MAKKQHKAVRKDTMRQFFSNFAFKEKFIFLKNVSTMDAYHPKQRITLSFVGRKGREYKYTTLRSYL